VNTDRIPQVTMLAIQRNIVGTHYFTALNGRDGAIAANRYEGTEQPKFEDVDLVPLKLLTFCVLVLKNGFTVTGESACVHPDKFDAEIGKKVAFEHAVNKIWPLMGYALKSELHAEQAR
jgi:hypothetical protein